MAATREAVPDEAGEERLAEGFAAGEERCLELAYRRWGTLVHTLARRSLGDEREAEDVTQQVFLAAWRGRQHYRSCRGGLPGWLVGITRHKIADALAARTRRAELVAAAAARAAVTVPPARDEPDRALDRELVQRELERLTAVQRRLIRLAYYGDLSQREIAARTGLPLGTVKSHIRRALLTLRGSLQNEATAG